MILTIIFVVNIQLILIKSHYVIIIFKCYVKENFCHIKFQIEFLFGKKLCDARTLNYTNQKLYIINNMSNDSPSYTAWREQSIKVVLFIIIVINTPSFVSF